jgi:hypothetical protein
MKENAMKVLIPLAALLVIIESILLLTKTTKKNEVILPPGSKTSVILSWEGNKNAKMGKTEEVVLKMKASKEVMIDAVDLYIKYDPTKITVSSFVADKNFVKPSFNKISQDRGMVVVNYLVSETKGYKLGEKEIELARLKVNYISEGQATFQLGESTLVVENGSAKVLPFNNTNLVINATL